MAVVSRKAPFLVGKFIEQKVRILFMYTVLEGQSTFVQDVRPS